jgi:hypothetical protein
MRQSEIYWSELSLKSDIIHVLLDLLKAAIQFAAGYIFFREGRE